MIKHHEGVEFIIWVNKSQALIGKTCSAWCQFAFWTENTHAITSHMLQTPQLYTLCRWLWWHISALKCINTVNVLWFCHCSEKLKYPENKCYSTSSPRLTYFLRCFCPKSNSSAEGWTFSRQFTRNVAILQIFIAYLRLKCNSCPQKQQLTKWLSLQRASFVVFASKCSLLVKLYTKCCPIITII